jgi:hypothetical protein
MAILILKIHASLGSATKSPVIPLQNGCDVGDSLDYQFVDLDFGKVISATSAIA